MNGAARAASDPVARGYLDAKRRVVEAGYERDVAWAEDLELVKPDAHYVLREGAFVIVNSGFRWAVVQKLWPRLIEAFHGFEPSRVDAGCQAPALKILNSPPKIHAILSLAEEVRIEPAKAPGGQECLSGWERIVRDAVDPPKLMRLLYIGKITCWHYAKVLGVDCVKPDVHLVRAATAAGYATPLALCEALRDRLGERLTVCDSVLWRYGEQQKARGWAEWPELWGGAST